MPPPVDYPWYTETSGPGLEQGDILLNTPVFVIPPGPIEAGSSLQVIVEIVNGIVLSQSCDLVAGKIDDVVLCPIYEKSELGQIRRFQKDDTWEELRRGQHYRYHLLNRCELTNLKREFTVVDLAKLFTLPLAFTQAHAKAQGNRIRLQPPYREHLAQSFARFYMRVGLPIDIPKFK